MLGSGNALSGHALNRHAPSWVDDERNALSLSTCKCLGVAVMPVLDRSASLRDG
jgi:hypothetical protein